MNVKTGRWSIAVTGTILMMCLGTVYAWSFFQDLLVRQYAGVYGWTNSQAAWVFSFAIFFLGLSAAGGGVFLKRTGPGKMALAGGILFALGHAIAALALRRGSLMLLILGYGVVGGTGLGLGYVTPVATVSAWFPDKKGLATGMVVMGFGFGALLMSKVFAPLFLSAASGDLSSAFLLMGGAFLILTVGSAAFLRMPADGSGQGPARKNAGPGFPSSTRAAVFSGRFLAVWLVFFCNIAAGIAVICFQSPLLQELLPRGLTADAAAAYGATLIAASSLMNGVGRFFWGAVSDRLGRTATFRVMLATEIAACALLIVASNPWVFAVLVCWVLFCYGGGFGAMPSLISEMAGPRLMASVYGAVLTAWSAAGMAGPQIFALIKDAAPGNAAFPSFLAAGGFLIAGFILTFAMRSGGTGHREASMF
jgi:OFA family oxalate/formate antiporter-like MFS transporter